MERLVWQTCEWPCLPKFSTLHLKSWEERGYKATCTYGDYPLAHNYCLFFFIADWCGLYRERGVHQWLPSLRCSHLYQAVYGVWRSLGYSIEQSHFTLTDSNKINLFSNKIKAILYYCLHSKPYSVPSNHHVLCSNSVLLIIQLYCTFDFSGTQNKYYLWSKRD